VPVAQFDDPLSTVLLDRDGELLSAAIASRRPVALRRRPRGAGEVRGGVLRFEDRRFAYHPGVDRSAVRARARQNLRGRGVRERRQHAHDAGGAARAQGPVAQRSARS
jgi:penicillin-binding protein 1C